MTIRSAFVPVLLAALILAPIDAALASRAPDTVSGTVTALPGGAQLVVNGKTYYLSLEGPALSQLQSLHVGDSVELALNGSAQSPASKVVAVLGSASH